MNEDVDKKSHSSGKSERFCLFENSQQSNVQTLNYLSTGIAQTVSNDQEVFHKVQCNCTTISTCGALIFFRRIDPQHQKSLLIRHSFRAPRNFKRKLCILNCELMSIFYFPTNKLKVYNIDEIAENISYEKHM